MRFPGLIPKPRLSAIEHLDTKDVREGCYREKGVNNGRRRVNWGRQLKINVAVDGTVEFYEGESKDTGNINKGKAILSAFEADWRLCLTILPNNYVTT